MPKRSSKQKDTQQLARSVLDAIVPDAELRLGGCGSPQANHSRAASQLSTTSHSARWLWVAAANHSRAALHRHAASRVETRARPR